jgi:hypothetical protein
MNSRLAAAVLAGAATTASALGLAACTSSSSQTTCNPATPVQAMATHGSLAVRTLRRDVASIVDSVDRQLESQPPGEGSGGSIPTTLGAALGLMASQLAALHYPPQYQHAAQAMVDRTQSLASSLRSGPVTTDIGRALDAALNASQQFYTTLGMPSECTTTPGNEPG